MLREYQDKLSESPFKNVHDTFKLTDAIKTITCMIT